MRTISYKRNTTFDRLVPDEIVESIFVDGIHKTDTINSYSFHPNEESFDPKACYLTYYDLPEPIWVKPKSTRVWYYIAALALLVLGIGIFRFSKARQ